MRRSFFSAVLSVLFGKVGSLLLSVIITPILVRLLGSGSYGDYAFVLSTLSVTMIIVNFGLKDGVRKFIAEDQNVEQWQSLIFGFYLKIAVFFACLAIGFILILDYLSFLDILVGTTLSQYVFIFCLLIGLQQLRAVGKNTLLGLGYERITEPLRVIKRGVSGVSAIILVFVGYGVHGALFGLVLGTLLINIVMFFVLRNKLNSNTIFQRTPKELPANKLLKYNLFTVILIFMTSTLYHVDIILVRLLLGDSEAGFYKGALVIAEFLWVVPIVLQVTLVHETSELWSQGRDQMVSQIASKVFRYSMLCILLPLIGLVVLADIFVPLYLGPEFVRAIDPLLLLLPGVFGFAMAKPMYAISQGHGNLRPLILATGLASGINVVLNIILIPHYGMNGAAVATSIGYGSMLMFHLIAARYVGFTPLQDPRLVEITLTGVTSLVLMMGMSNIIPNDFMKLIVIPPIGAIIFVLVAIQSGAIDEDEQNFMQNRVQEAINKL